MTIEVFIAEVRALAIAEGARASEAFWSAVSWRERFANGLSPSEAWQFETCPALRAM